MMDCAVVITCFILVLKDFLFSFFSGLESLSPSSDGEHQPQQQAQSHRGVKPVYLRCSQGSVSWLYPRGALRVVLRYGTAGKEFQVRKTTTKISLVVLRFYTHTHTTFKKCLLPEAKAIDFSFLFCFSFPFFSHSHYENFEYNIRRRRRRHSRLFPVATTNMFSFSFFL